MFHKILFLTTFISLTSVYSYAESKLRPNFIFIITDDISPDDLGPYGNEFVKTPHLDAMAQNGLVFENAYNTISSCSPSRCSIITGRYPHNTGAPELGTKLPLDQKTFVQSLKNHGYYTLLSGKNHMGKAEQLGFDEEEDAKPSGGEIWVKHLLKRPKEQPFFFWFASHDAHHAWQLNDKAPVYDPNKLPVPPMLFDGPLTREELANYYHEVSRTDHYTGEIIKTLKSEGIYDNTYIIYCSDNGRPLPRCKTYLYESGIQTPLIITGPNVKAARTKSLVSSIDYSATILELADIEKPKSIQGQSFAKLLRDPQSKARDVVFAERNWHVYAQHERMVRLGDFLYIWNAWPNQHNNAGESSCFKFPAVRELWQAADEGKLTPAQKQLTLPKQPTDSLFNVEKDPYQFKNLASNPEYSEQLKKMQALLKDWIKQTGDSVPKNPTLNRQPLHERAKFKGVRGEFPGAIHHATKINHPGPFLLK